MQRGARRSIRVGVGVVVAGVVLFELLALWSFVSAFFVSNESVLFAWPGGTFTLPWFVPVAALSAIAAVVVVYVRDGTLPRPLDWVAVALAEAFGIVDRRDVRLRGALLYDGLRWSSAFTDSGTVVDVEPECPHCRTGLTRAHVPAVALSDPDDSGGTADAGRGHGSMLTSVVQYASDTGAVGLELVEARACPECDFAATAGEAGVPEVVGDRFEDGYRAVSERDLSVLAEQATRRVGRPAAPGDLWDQYLLGTPDAVGVPVNGAGRVDTGGVEETEEGADGQPTVRPVESYEALEDLQTRASGTDRLVERLTPDALQPFVARVLGATYLVERRELLERRQRVREELVTRLRTLDRQVGDRVESARLATAARERPDDPERALDAIEFAAESVESLSADLDRSFLTHGEQRRLGRLAARLDAVGSYVDRARTFAEHRERVQSGVEEFETQYGPYDGFQRYMPGDVQDTLAREAERIHDAVEALVREYQFPELPAADEAWLVETRAQFEHLVNVVPVFNDGDPDRGVEGFVEREIAQYDDLLETEEGELNPGQRRAVVTNDRHNIVDASAGTGKTLTLVERFEYLVEKGVDPSDILVLTLTKPTRRMLAADIVATVDSVRGHHDHEVLNFHGLSSRIVTDAMGHDLPDDWDRDAARERYAEGFLTRDATMKNRHPDAFERFERHATAYRELTGEHLSSDRLTKFLEQARSFARTPEAVRESLTESKRQQYEFGHAAAAVLDAYLERAGEQLAPLDETDKLETATRVVRENSEAFAGRYEHVLVDEFQDVSDPEVELVRALLTASEDTRLFAVGDDWQSIYGFKGSNPSFFREFETTFSPATRTTLEVNYRCPPAVVDAGRRLMDDGYHAHKPVRAHEENPDVTPVLHHVEDAFDYEDRMVEHARDVVVERLENGLAPSEVLVLVRNLSNNPMAARFTELLSAAGYEVDDDNTSDSVTLQPIHRSKGESADCVVLLHATNEDQQGLPNADRTHELVAPAKAATVSQRHEERRLCYVALTRTSGELHVLGREGNLAPDVAVVADAFERTFVESEFGARWFESHVLEDGPVGEVVAFERRPKLAIGTLRIEDGPDLRFSALPWEFDDAQFGALCDLLEREPRVHLEDVSDERESKYAADFNLTPASSVSLLGPESSGGAEEGSEGRSDADD